MLSEALTATVLLLKISMSDMSAEEKIASLWSSTLDLQKGYFTGEKFFTQAPKEGKHYFFFSYSDND